MACGVFGTINRRIGGLENKGVGRMPDFKINRRIGGLEKSPDNCVFFTLINRRIGGLERQKIY